MLNIRDRDECKAACDALGIPIDKLVNGRICFKAGNGKCRQQNTAGAKTSRICKNEGKYRELDLSYFYYSECHTAANLHLLFSSSLFYRGGNYF